MSLIRRLLDPIAELSVIGSFSRLGYQLRSPTFDPGALDVQLQGQVFVVTGASSGLGEATARQLWVRGATVVIVGRSADKLADAASRIEAAAPLPSGRPGVILQERADLAELDAVEALAERLLLAHPHIAGLVLNAGLLVAERQLTRGGHERAFATHVLSPFLLTHRLIPALKKQPGSRVVWVSSGGMYTQHLDLTKCEALQGPYDGVEAYAQQKRAQVILSEELAKRLKPAGIRCNSMHPGWTDTPGVVSGLPAFHRWMGPVLRDVDQGADTIVWLVASPEATDSGGFYLDRVRRSPEVLPGTRHSDAEREALWQRCVALTGVGG